MNRKWSFSNHVAIAIYSVAIFGFVRGFRENWCIGVNCEENRRNLVERIHFPGRNASNSSRTSSPEKKFVNFLSEMENGIGAAIAKSNKKNPTDFSHAATDSKHGEAAGNPPIGMERTKRGASSPRRLRRRRRCHCSHRGLMIGKNVLGKSRSRLTNGKNKMGKMINGKCFCIKKKKRRTTTTTTTPRPPYWWGCLSIEYCSSSEEDDSSDESESDERPTTTRKPPKNSGSFYTYGYTYGFGYGYGYGYGNTSQPATGNSPSAGHFPYPGLHNNFHYGVNPYYGVRQ